MFLDVGGQEKLRPLWRSYTRCTDGIIFVIDSVDLERMEEAKMEVSLIGKLVFRSLDTKVLFNLKQRKYHRLSKNKLQEIAEPLAKFFKNY